MKKKRYIAYLNIKRSKLLPNNLSPKDDVVEWLFVKIKEVKYFFTYKILNKENAKYNSSFEVEIVFFRSDIIKEIIEFNNLYEIYRGEEKVGKIKIKE